MGAAPLPAAQPGLSRAVRGAGAAHAAQTTHPLLGGVDVGFPSLRVTQ